MIVQPVEAADIERMRGQLFFDGADRGAKLSRFWLLLLLAAVIASCGVVGDSTATVIGAMIVAPLMTPILGTALAAALADRRNLLRCVVLVVAGAAAVILIGYLVGSLTTIPTVAADNSQVASRVSPRLIDLLAALATGAVGAIALSRSDISDTLPGVAIAISLVPPLAVVGLTLESGEPSQAWGALLLFLANVSAILAMGTLVMALYRVPAHAAPGVMRRRSAGVVVAAMVVLVAFPLAATSKRLATTESVESKVRDLADDWADAASWEVVDVSTEAGEVVVEVAGPQPAPEPSDLRTAMDHAGLEKVTIQVELTPATYARLPGQG